MEISEDFIDRALNDFRVVSEEAGQKYQIETEEWK